MYKNFKPLNNNVVVKRDTEPKRTQSGLYFGNSEEKQQTGAVIAVGTGKHSSTGVLLPMTIKAGDRVFLPDYSGIELGDDYLLLSEDQIMGILE